MGDLPGRGDLVVVCGLGVTGRSTVHFLLGRGCRVVVTADRTAPDLPAELAEATAVVDLAEPPEGTTLIVTSPGFRPTNVLFRSAGDRGVEVIGDVELAWRVDQAGSPRPWLVVTGTNGKTTTVQMLESILTAAGLRATACGNVGWPALDAVLAEPRQDVIAAELSSFQLHYAPSVRPRAGAVLNLVEDHLDWYGALPDDPGSTQRAMAGYGADKAGALAGEVAVAVVDDPGAAVLLAAAPGRPVAVTQGPPADGLGVADGMLADVAFGAGALLPAAEVRPAGAHNVTNALTAAALALAAGVTRTEVAAGLRAFTPGAHRNTVIADVGAVRYVDDSKATNPHAAQASLTAYPSVVWIAGGQLKGASIDDLIRTVADRLRGVVVLGVDAPLVLAALSRHAPDVPVRHVPGTDHRIMTDVVRAAADLAAPGDVVLLAPAAASLDMFRSYAHRGQAFAAAVARLDRA